MRAPTSLACLLFDLDGTLVDSVADLAASANATRAHYGLAPLDARTVGTYVGDGAPRLIARTFADAPTPVDEREALRWFRAHYLEHCLERTAAYPGVESTLAWLREHLSVPMAIVSNKPQPMCEKIAAGLALDRWIDVVVGARPSIAVKPDPELLRVALRELGLSAARAGDVEPEPLRVGMVGDSANDVLSGRALGAYTVGVTYGIGDVERMRAAEPHRVVDAFSDLIDVFGDTERASD